MITQPSRINIIGRIASVRTRSGALHAGEIVSETKHTVRMRTDTKIATIIKSQSTIAISNTSLTGSQLIARPAERITGA